VLVELHGIFDQQSAQELRGEQQTTIFLRPQKPSIKAFGSELPYFNIIRTEGYRLGTSAVLGRVFSPFL
jgi:hypothetical protein